MNSYLIIGPLNRESGSRLHIKAGLELDCTRILDFIVHTVLDNHGSGRSVDVSTVTVSSQLR